MNRALQNALKVGIALTSVACMVVLAISITPGVLNDLLFRAMLLSCVIIPLAGIAAVFGLIMAVKMWRLSGRRIPWGRVGVIFAILFGTYVLLKLYVPRRIAFAGAEARGQRSEVRGQRSGVRSQRSEVSQSRASEPGGIARCWVRR